MTESAGASAPRKLLIVAPNWVGDVVMATPVLAAVREQFAAARITHLIRPHLTDVLAGTDWCDDEITWPTVGGLSRERATLRLANHLRGEHFDAALLLTNSFRSAAVAWLARIPRRIGYARDGRSLLLNDRLTPERSNGRFTPVSMVDYYAILAERMGVIVGERRLRLALTDAEERAGRHVLRAHGVDPDSRYTVICPGAAFGAAKCWPPDRFAALCDRLADDFSLPAVVAGATAEAPLMRDIASQARSSVKCLLEPGTTLGSLKSVIHGAGLTICNDSGPRHIANAFGMATVAIFGPTDPIWAVYDAPREIRLREPVECSPCQLRTCPIDHRCMTRISVDQVVAAIEKLGPRAHDSASGRTDSPEEHGHRRDHAAAGEGDAV